jgi:RNA polymerase sigma-70 factor (sigma-E family)
VIDIAVSHPGSRLVLVTDQALQADDAVVNLYAAHYASLVRLAAMLLHDVAAAEDVVQDAFVAMHGAWHRLRDPDKAIAYLRRSVVNGSRSNLRHRGVVERNLPSPPADGPSAEAVAAVAAQQAAVMTALRALPRRQRETLVLRYYADLSEAQIAETLGISQGAVKSHASRGVAALRQLLEDTP